MATTVTAVVEARTTEAIIGDKRPRDGRSNASHADDDLGLDQEYMLDCDLRRPPVEADEDELCVDDFLQQQAPPQQGRPITTDDDAGPSASTTATVTVASSTSMQTTHTSTTGGPGRPPITFKKFRSGALTTSASVSTSGGVGSGAVATTPSSHPNLTITATPNPGSRRSGRAVD